MEREISREDIISEIMKKMIPELDENQSKQLETVLKNETRGYRFTMKCN